MPSQEQVDQAMQEACLDNNQDANKSVWLGPTGIFGKPSVKNNLLHQRNHHAAEVKRLDRLITLLDENPDVQEILELIKGY